MTRPENISPQAGTEQDDFMREGGLERNAQRGVERGAE
jgi:hypothetical protein